MLGRIKELWREVEELPPGERFQHLYASYAEHDSDWVRGLMQMVALGCFTLGIVFMFIARPAFVPFTLAIAIMATQSCWVAQRCDRAELGTRELVAKLRRRSQQRPQRDRLSVT